MPEFLTDPLGVNRELAECISCGDTIDLEADDHGLFAAGMGMGGETQYSAVLFCSADCGRKHMVQEFMVADRKGGFVTEEDLLEVGEPP